MLFALIRILQSAVTLLNAALLESAPSELLPPPRRSKRSAGDESQNESPAPEKKRIKRKLNDLLPPAAKDDCMDEKIKLCPEHEQLHDDDDDEDNTNAASADVGKQRKRVARNVGGWISPDFAKTLDNSWLTVDSPVNKFVLSHYVPQVGDTVL